MDVVGGSKLGQERTSLAMTTPHAPQDVVQDRDRLKDLTALLSAGFYSARRANGVCEWHWKKYLAALMCSEVRMNGVREHVMMPPRMTERSCS